MPKCPDAQIADSMIWAGAGAESIVLIDTTYRIVIEGHCCMPVGTVSPDCKFKIIGYGVCSHEDIEAHKTVVRQIKAAVDTAVRECAVAIEPF